VNVATHLQRLARERGDQPAIVQPDGRQITFAQAEERTSALAGGLAALGLVPGDRVLLLVPMSIELYEALIALLRGLYTVVLLDPSAPTVEENLQRVGLSAFIGSGKAHLLRLKHPSLRGLDRYLSTGFTLLPHRNLGRLSGPGLGPLPPPSEDFPALLTFTTGSTGRPKTVARSHRFLEAQRSILTEHMGLEPGDVDLPTLPVFLLNSLAAGATCVLPDADLREVGAVEPRRVIRQLLDHRCTSTSGSPAFFAPLAAALKASGQTLPDLKKLFTGGARVPPELLADLVEVAPNARIEVLYGSTEAEPIASISASEVLGETAAAERRGLGSCVGRPVPRIALRIEPLGERRGARSGPPAGPATDTTGRPSESLRRGEEPEESERSEPTKRRASAAHRDERARPCAGGVRASAASDARGARSGPPSEIGEILVSGEHVNQGYFEDPRSDAANKLREDGVVWHRTGDTGYLDERGRVWLVGRVQDMVGELHPFMVEGRVDGLDWVKRSALVELDEPVLAVCLGEGAPEDWEARLRASSGVDRVVEVDSVPLDPRHNAKVDRAALRALLARG
jgi:acyl-CoA synthetase (AMP-forming)/AMP-acid ligase II